MDKTKLMSDIEQKSASVQERVDLRSRRTRHHIDHALTRLLLRRSYDAIRVSDITKKAEIGRGTFYAHFDNKDELLQPGLFGRIQVFGGEADALLVPDSAVVSDQARKIVFTVGADNIVKAQPVLLGALSDGLRVVRTGLAADAMVVIDGLANPMVRPGAKVVPQKSQLKAAAN